MKRYPQRIQTPKVAFLCVEVMAAIVFPKWTALCLQVYEQAEVQLGQHSALQHLRAYQVPDEGEESFCQERR